MAATRSSEGERLGNGRGVQDPAPVLSLRGIRKSFGENHVLRGIDLDLCGGEVVALVGENGAGKSTLTGIMSGAHRPDGGEIRVVTDSQDTSQHEGGSAPKLTARSFSVPQDAMACGIHVIYQEIRQNLFPSLDVATNLFARDADRSFGSLFVRKDVMHRRAAEVLGSIGVSVDTRRPVSELSIGDQQMIQIAAALQSELSVLILDEPTAALDQTEAEALFDQVNRLRDSGVAVVYISHRLPEVFSLADRIVVLRDGKVSLTGKPAELSERDVVSAMVGADVEDFYPKEKHTTDVPLLEISGLSGRGFSDVTMTVHAGEVLGIGGVPGSGRSHVLRALFGLDPECRMAPGMLRLRGQGIAPRNPRQAIDAGIAYLTSDRHKEGLALLQSITANESLATLGQVTRGGVVELSKEKARAEEISRRLGVKAESLQSQVGSLSGGNQQKVLLARWLLSEPSVLLLEEPTRGVDVGAKAEIYQIINEAAAAGLAVILVSSDLPELVEMSDRVLVMRDGRVATELTGDDVTQEDVLQYALGEAPQSPGPDFEPLTSGTSHESSRS